MENINRGVSSSNQCAAIRSAAGSIIERNPLLAGRLLAARNPPCYRQWSQYYQNMNYYPVNSAIVYGPAYNTYIAPVIQYGDPAQGMPMHKPTNLSLCPYRVYDIPDHPQQHHHRAPQDNLSTTFSPRRFTGIYPGPMREYKNINTPVQAEPLPLVQETLEREPLDLSKQITLT
ncbi:hypothetical protein [Acerihabitans arboris]|uniref:Uncharacterized protein n=1 Tax=Acerihabitans arboris TaxID=2691583 RepID=A0A845SNN5_9GAMM|nr:hypothetical protein [Acerihabitans arboris]NDL64556.1 hypothetical protein [Acerihabitans arboris]